MSVEQDVEYEQMSPEEYMEQVERQQKAGLIQAQAEGNLAGPDPAPLAKELHNVIHDYGKDHVPEQTRTVWGVFANQHPSLSNFDIGEAYKMKSLIRQYESLLITALPKTIMTPKIMRMIFQGRALAYMNVSKGKGGFEAQMTRSTMIGVAGFNKSTFNPSINVPRQRPQSRFNRWLGRS